jgi:hypothetical protein
MNDTLPGNPYATEARRLSDGDPTVLAILTLAHEQRTANLIAIEKQGLIISWEKIRARLGMSNYSDDD